MTALSSDWQEAAQAIRRGGLVVLPTDTLYGVVGSALSPAVVERLYALRRRDAHKPFIILVGDEADLDKFEVKMPARTRQLLSKIWPGPVSVIVAQSDPQWAYLHRGAGGLSFRLPAKASLRALLRETGPLVAPSANPQGETPAVTVDQARAYFGEAVDYYLDEGRLEGTPSALVDARFDPPQVLRPAPGLRL